MIILIDNYDSFTFNLYQHLAQFHEVLVFRNDKITCEAIKQLNPEAIILSPGPGHPKTAGISIELIKKLSPHIPILGICLGHQAIACAFGGQVVQHNEIVHGKASQVSHINSTLFNEVPSLFKAGRYHSLTVDLHSLPAELVISAICDTGSVMAIEHVNYPCYGIQFHPESILTPFGRKILDNFVTHCTIGKHYDFAHSNKTLAA